MDILTVILALCFIESTDKHTVINIQDGGSASYGYCQVKLSTARHLGFSGHVTDLWLKKEVNLKWAKKYLEKQYKKYKNWEEAIAAYNSGTVKRNKFGELVNRKYVNKVVKQIRK